MRAIPTLYSENDFRSLDRQTAPTAIYHHSHSRSRSLLSLPTSPMHQYPRRRFLSNKSISALSMPRILFLATVFSAFFLLRHINIDLDLFRPLTLVPVNTHTIIPGRSPPLMADHVTYDSIAEVDNLPITEPPPAEPQLTAAPTKEQLVPVRVDVTSEFHTDPPSEMHLSASKTIDSKELEDAQVPPPLPASEPGYRDPADFSTFDAKTALNYFHMHKTGGVSFKERLFDFFMMDEAQTPSSRKVNVFDTCHMSSTARNELGLEKEWSCDWDEISNLPESARNTIDVIVGHQYWEKGAGYWIPNRDVRYFTVMRHPLHRKISFFYHFFVRNAGRKEDSVTTDELIQFVLGKKMPDSPLVRDAGPGYYASRLWSDGLRGYNDYHRFVISEEVAASMVYNSIRRLRKNVVFIGLQTQEPASLCMLKKTVEAFVKAHELWNLTGLDDIDKQRERKNTGSYSLSGKLLWERMNEEQRNEFRRVEKVDLGIYEEAVKMFHEMVKRFGCEDLVVEQDDNSIAL